MKINLRPHMRFLLIYWSATFGVLFLLRLFLALTEPLVPASSAWQKSRIHGALSAIEQPGFTPSSGSLVLMLGASEAQIGFDPLRFDSEVARRGLTTVSYNLALDNVGTFLPLYLERVRMALADSGVRARVIFLDLPVTRFTLRARQSFLSHASLYDVDAALFHPAIWRSGLLSTGEKLMLSFNKWVLGERSLVQLQRLTSALVGLLSGSNLYITPSGELFHRADLHPEPAWNKAERGRYYLNREREPEVVDSLMEAAATPRFEKEDYRYLVKCCDAVDLVLDPDYVAQVAELVRSLLTVSDHVVLVPLPESPRMKRSAEAQARLREAQKFIARASGADLWIPESRLPFPETDFFDLSHFRPEGVEKYSRYLASELPESWLR